MGHGNIGHGRGLTRDEAEARARLLSDVRYQVEVDLTGPSSELFGSVATVRFACAEPGAATFLDLGARSVESMELNGRPLPADAFAGGRVRLDGLAAENQVRIAATCAYERSAVGLHRFEDPVDGNVYVYNHFEPYAARVFACFDQPDLKAEFELAVRAPAGWRVLSNGAPVGGQEALPGGAVRWRFAPTRPIPTYIMVLVAGPWHGVTQRHGDVELGLWCRRSLAPHLDAEEFLEVTKQGFDFYERTFAYPYPFGKYDQVLVPEMAGAMEQAGCVTFSEEFVFRSRVTDAAREVRANVILHELGNTDLRDFLVALEEASGRDLRPWSRAWLEQAGVNTLEASLEVEGSGQGARVGAFTIHQRAPGDHHVLRPHRVTVGFYDRDGEGLVLRKRLELDVTGETVTVPELAGLPAPDLALLNDADLTYAKVRLDPRSLRALRDNLGRIRDPLARTVGWGVCWDMVRDADLPTGDYLRLVLEHAADEREVGVLQDVLAKLRHAIEVYGDPAARAARRARLADVTLAALDRAAPGGDLQLAWARSFIATARSGEHLDLLQALLDGSGSVEGLVVDTDLRWEIVCALATAGVADEPLIAAELDRDPADAGRRKAAAARAARPMAAAKAAAWDAATGLASPSRPLLDALSEGFHRPGQEELLEPYAGRFFAVLGELRARRDLDSMLAFTGRMFPRLLIGEPVVAMTDAWLEANPDAGPLRRRLIERTDAIHRALRARAADQAAG